MREGPFLVVFDCDGTLVDSQHMIVAAMQAAFESRGHPPPEPEAVRSIIGLSLEAAVDALIPEKDPVEVAALTQAYKDAFLALRRADHHDPLFPGTREALDALKAREDVLLGIATGKSRRGLDVVLEREGLRSHFFTLQTADDAPSKPHPAMIERAMAETGVAPERTVMVGDTSFDMQMARQAGTGALGVAWGYHPVTRLVSAGAHHVADSFSQLLGLIDRVMGAGEGT